MKLQGTSGRITGMSLCEDLGSLLGNGHTISFPNTYLQGDTKLLWPLAKPTNFGEHRGNGEYSERK